MDRELNPLITGRNRKWKGMHRKDKELIDATYKRCPRCSVPIEKVQYANSLMSNSLTHGSNANRFMAAITLHAFVVNTFAMFAALGLRPTRYTLISSQNMEGYMTLGQMAI